MIVVTQMKENIVFLLLTCFVDNITCFLISVYFHFPRTKHMEERKKKQWVDTRFCTHTMQNTFYFWLPDQHGMLLTYFDTTTGR